MPWPLTHDEVDQFQNHGLVETSFEDLMDKTEIPPVRRFRAAYFRQ
jgi:hypothetical protein